ncbi:MAG: Zn-dependent metalloprotease [Phenylobacterium sp.]|jgi:Zn-dependent metalloprotease
MKNLNPLAVTIAIALSSMSAGVMAEMKANIKANIKTQAQPTFVAGSLGVVTAQNTINALKNILATQVAYQANGNEEFAVKREWVDELGKRHTHVSQTINGLNVYGTSLIVHADLAGEGVLANPTSGNIYAVSGTLAVNADTAALKSFALNHKASSQARKLASKIGEVTGEPELAYVYVPGVSGANGATTLVWKMEVSWNNGPGDFGRDIFFYNVQDNSVVTRHPQVHSAKSWRTHTLNGGSSNSAPGTLLCTNTQSCGGNAAAQRAHDGASWVYDYYSQKHGRDSLNNNGMALVSSVDLGEQNAYWTGSQMIYGQAGGSVDNDFTSDFDVIGHEFTHGVTSNTANLVYRDESGALNEAWSDIFGVTAESFRNGTTSSTWLLGDGLYNTPGKAFRYMSNPTQDGQSKDYYPERYTGTQDNGGVHLNSGIGNLAYVLLVDGGTHPRNKTTATVPALGMAKAEKIFYRALTTYMSQNTQFSGARTATAQAAQDLYGATEKTAVETAWCAVGVGTCPDGPIDPPPTGSELQNGVATTGIGASAGQDVVYTLQVPAGATDISFASSGGSGDADMYVKFGSTPTDSSYDCRPYAGGNNENCTGTQTGGTYYVRLKAYSTFAGVSLTGSYTDGSTGGPTPINDSLPNLSVGAGQWSQYTQDLAAGYSTMTISISGGTGDADLFVKHGSTPTASSYNCRPYKDGNNESCTLTNPASGTWYIGLNGYTTATGVTLTVTAN